MVSRDQSHLKEASPSSGPHNQGYEAKWSRYLGEAESANTTIQDDGVEVDPWVWLESRWALNKNPVGWTIQGIMLLKSPKPTDQTPNFRKYLEDFQILNEERFWNPTSKITG